MLAAFMRRSLVVVLFTILLAPAAGASSRIYTEGQDMRFRTYSPSGLSWWQDIGYRTAQADACLDDADQCRSDLLNVGSLDSRPVGPYAGFSTNEIAAAWSFLRTTESHPGFWEFSNRAGKAAYEGMISAFLDQLGKGSLPLYMKDALQQQLDADATTDRLQKLLTNFASTGRRVAYFEIGNEPNVYPAMPADLYAWYYLKWRKRILDELQTYNARNPNAADQLTAKFMPAGLWIFEGMPQYTLNLLDTGFSAEILFIDFDSRFYTDTRLYYNQFLQALSQPLFGDTNLGNITVRETTCSTVLPPAPTTFIYPPNSFPTGPYAPIPPRGPIPLAKSSASGSKVSFIGPSYPPWTSTYPAVPLVDLGPNTYKMANQGSKCIVTTVFGPKRLVDVGALHFYPYIGAHSPYGAGSLTKHFDNLKSLAQLAGDNSSTGKVWLTEFGNWNAFDDATTATKVMAPMLKFLRDDNVPQIDRWFWYQAKGDDPKFDNLPAMPSSDQPLGVAAVFGLDFLQHIRLAPGFSITVANLTAADSQSLYDDYLALQRQKPTQGLFDKDGNLRIIGELYRGYASTKSPRSADFDGDGYMDLLSFRDDRVDFFKGTWNGELVDGPSLVPSKLNAPHGSSQAFKVGDFNNDGADDLIQFLPGVSPTPSQPAFDSGAFVWYGRRGASSPLYYPTKFIPWQGYAIGTARDYKVGDFDGDGFDDLAHVVPGQSYTNVWYGKPMTFSPVRVPPYPLPFDVAAGVIASTTGNAADYFVADFDFNGSDDLVRPFSRTLLEVWLGGQGARSFTRSVQASPANVGPASAFVTGPFVGGWGYNDTVGRVFWKLDWTGTRATFTPTRW